MSTDRRRVSSLLVLGVHELRTPVTVAAGYLRMLLQGHGGDLSAAQRTLAERAERSVDRIGTLVAELRDIASLESGGATFERRKLSLFRIVAEAAGQTGDARLHLHGSDAECWIQGDAPRLKAAFASLMRAAVRGRRDDDCVPIDCRVRTRERRHTASVSIGGRSTGATERARDLDEWRGGLGLSVPIARRVIEAHGGRVRSAATRVKPAIMVELPLCGSGRANRSG